MLIDLSQEDLTMIRKIVSIFSIKLLTNNIGGLQLEKDEIANMFAHSQAIMNRIDDAVNKSRKSG